MTDAEKARAYDRLVPELEKLASAVAEMERQGLRELMGRQPRRRPAPKRDAIDRVLSILTFGVW